MKRYKTPALLFLNYLIAAAFYIYDLPIWGNVFLFSIGALSVVFVWLLTEKANVLEEINELTKSLLSNEKQICELQESLIEKLQNNHNEELERLHKELRGLQRYNRLLQTLSDSKTKFIRSRQRKIIGQQRQIELMTKEFNRILTEQQKHS